MSIRAAVIRNYLGIRLAEYRFGPKGAVLEGANATGKTSGIKAIRAALTGKGCSADAIRNGEDEAEIIVDLDDATVRRTITKSSSTVTVSNESGARVRSPQTFLNELLGVSPFDPLDLVFEHDVKKRKARILEAVPCKLPPEMLARWVPAGVDCLRVSPDMHGLDALEALRADFYGRRTAANKAAKETLDAYDRSERAANAARPDTERPKLTEAEAIVARDRARDDVSRADAMIALVRDDEARAARVKARVDELRGRAENERKLAEAAAPDPATHDALTASCDAAMVAFQDAQRERDRIAQLLAQAEIALAEADERYSAATDEVVASNKRAADERLHRERAEGLDAQADELAATAPATEPILELEQKLEAARTAARNADMQLTHVAAWKTHDELQARAWDDGEAHKRAKAKAKQLDEIVRQLTDVAPGEILAASGGVPGLRIEGDSISLDGVLLDHLSGAEQLKFAVSIARRLNEKAKIIIVDGLERLDAEQLPVFLEESTRDGFQVIATRVGSGPAHAVKIGGES